MSCVKVGLLLLDGVVGQVDHHVVHLTYVGTIILRAESGEPKSTKPDFQGFITCHEDVDSEIEFLPTDEQWLVNISRNNVWLFRVLLDLFELGDQENTQTLCTSSRLHNPGSVRGLFEFLLEDGVVSGQNICHWNNVQIYQITVFVTLSDRVVLLLHIFPKSLDVFDHKVLSCELSMIREMV